MVFFSPVTYSIGSPNMGGVFGKILVASIEDIESMPNDVNGVITGDIVMKPGKYFVDVYHTQGMGEMKFDRQGERDGGSIKATLDFSVPGLGLDNMRFLDNALNGQLCLMAYDSEGVRRVMGIVKDNGKLTFPAYLESSAVTTGKAAADKRGATYSFTCDYIRVPPRYNGDVAGLLLEVPLALPASNITNSGASANWGAVAGVTTFLLDVSTSENFGSFVAGYEDLEVTGTTEAITGLAASTTYYFRLRSKVGNVVSSPSNVFSFTTTA